MHRTLGSFSTRNWLSRLLCTRGCGPMERGVEPWTLKGAIPQDQGLDHLGVQLFCSPCLYCEWRLCPNIHFLDECPIQWEIYMNVQSKLHTMSEKVSSNKQPKDATRVSRPQITPAYTDSLEGVCPMIVATQLPPEVGLSKDTEGDSLSNTPIIFSDTLKSKYGRGVCHYDTRSMENSHVTRTEFPQNGRNASKLEWVEQYEPGVYITFTSLPSGQKGLKRVRFSRKRFTEREAELWWEENQVTVYQKYDIEGYSNSS